jgi:hypothetical protein
MLSQEKKVFIEAPQGLRKLPVPVISSGARNLKSLIIQKLKISPFSRNDKFYRFRTP